VVRGGVRDAVTALEARGVKLPAPFAADTIACWISEFWLGMEFVNLIGTARETTEHEVALDAVQTLLEQLDALVRKPSNARGRR
jgi:hypothetical protein